MSQIIELHQHEQVLEKQLERSTSFFQGELAEVNRSYFELWIKQCFVCFDALFSPSLALMRVCAVDGRM